MKFAGKSKIACRRSNTLRRSGKRNGDCGRMKDWRSSLYAGAEGASFLKKRKRISQAKGQFFSIAVMGVSCGCVIGVWFTAKFPSFGFFAVLFF